MPVSFCRVLLLVLLLLCNISKKMFLFMLIYVSLFLIFARILYKTNKTLKLWKQMKQWFTKLHRWRS